MAIDINGHRLCEALADSTRARLLQQLVRVFPSKLTVSEITEGLVGILGKKISRTAVAFHLAKLREARLVELDGSGKGYRASETSLTIRFDGDGLRVEAMVRER